MYTYNFKCGLNRLAYSHLLSGGDRQTDWRTDVAIYGLIVTFLFFHQAFIYYNHAKFDNNNSCSFPYKSVQFIYFYTILLKFKNKVDINKIIYSYIKNY